jgi:hypothetical protein
MEIGGPADRSDRCCSHRFAEGPKSWSQKHSTFTHVMGPPCKDPFVPFFSRLLRNDYTGFARCYNGLPLDFRVRLCLLAGSPMRFDSAEDEVARFIAIKHFSLWSQDIELGFIFLKKSSRSISRVKPFRQSH